MFSPIGNEMLMDIKSAIDEGLYVHVVETRHEGEAVSGVLMAENCHAMLKVAGMVDEAIYQAEQVIESFRGRLADRYDVADGIEFILEGQHMVMDSLYVCAVSDEEENSVLTLIGTDADKVAMAALANRMLASAKN